MTLEDAVIGLKAYKEVDERMEQLWRNLDAAIVTPRMDANARSLPKIQASADVIELDGKADKSIRGLLTDLEKMLSLLGSKLPSDLLHALCNYMMGDMIPRLIRNWLSTAVPTSLNGMAEFEEMMEDSREFCAALDALGYIGLEELQQWVDNAPKIWLDKCRESALDTIRTRLAHGIGQSKPVEKVEKHMVSLSEGKELATSGAGATADTNDWGDDWGDAWGDDDQGAFDSTPKDTEGQTSTAAAGPADAEDDGTDAWGWGDDDNDAPTGSKPATKSKDDDDTAAEAWGWGEEDNTHEEPEVAPASKAPSSKPPLNPSGTAARETRELVLKETYHISSMPEPVLDLIFAILDDGVRLAKGGDEYVHVTPMAPGLFDLPTSALALFRAISPHYYALDGRGNM